MSVSCSAYCWEGQHSEPETTIWDLDPGGGKVKISLTGIRGDGDLARNYRMRSNNDNIHCAWSPDGTWIAGGPLGDSATHIWKTSTFQRRHSHTTWKGGLLAVSPDGRWVATALANFHNWEEFIEELHYCWIWDVDSGELHQTLVGHTNFIRAAVFNSETTRIVTGSYDSTIRIWDVETGGQLVNIEDGTRRHVDAVVFSGDGRMVLSHFQVSHSTTELDRAKIWDVLSGALLFSLPETGFIHYSFSCVSFSPCSSYVAWVPCGEDSDKAVVLWRTCDWSCVAEVPSWGSKVTHIAFSPDGRVLCCGTEAGAVFFYYMHDLVSANQD